MRIPRFRGEIVAGRLYRNRGARSPLDVVLGASFQEGNKRWWAYAFHCTLYSDPPGLRVYKKTVGPLSWQPNEDTLIRKILAADRGFRLASLGLQGETRLK